MEQSMMVSGTMYIIMGFAVVIVHEQLTLPFKWLLHDRFDAPTYTGKPGDRASYRRVKIPLFRFSAFRFRLHGSRLSMRSGSPACGGDSALGVLTGSKPHEAGNRTSCNFLF